MRLAPADAAQVFSPSELDHIEADRFFAALGATSIQRGRVPLPTHGEPRTDGI
jgi:hypothetical protein